MIRVHAFTCVMALLFLRIIVKKIKDAKVELSQDNIIGQLQKIKLTLFKMPGSDKIQTKLTRLNSNQVQLKRIFELKKYI